MENRSDTDSEQSLDDWIFVPPVDSEVITMVSAPTSPESDDGRSKTPKEVENEIEIRVSESTVAGGDKEEAAMKVLPPLMDPSWEWKEDGIKKEKKESNEVSFKEIIEALLRNSSGVKVEQGGENYVEILKPKGFKFP